MPAKLMHKLLAGPPASEHFDLAYQRIRGVDASGSCPEVLAGAISNELSVVVPASTGSLSTACVCGLMMKS